MTSLELNSWGQVAQPLPPHFWLMVIESVSEHELSFLLHTTVLPIDFSWPSWLDGQLRECLLHPPNPKHYPGPLDRPELNCREPDSFNLLVSLDFKAVPIELRRTPTQHSTRLVYSTSLQLPRRNKLAHWSTGLKLEPGPQNKLIHFWASWLQHIYNFTSPQQVYSMNELRAGTFVWSSTNGITLGTFKCSLNKWQLHDRFMQSTSNIKGIMNPVKFSTILIWLTINVNYRRNLHTRPGHIDFDN